MKKKNYDIDYENKIITVNGKKISYSKHFNTDESCILAKDKIKTSTLLLENGIKVPAFLKLDLHSNVDKKYLFQLF